MQKTAQAAKPTKRPAGRPRVIAEPVRLYTYVDKPVADALERMRGQQPMSPFIAGILAHWVGRKA
jgi:hypothetical protein